MTDERAALEALARCRHLPGSWAKRFAHDLAAMPENTILTPAQRQALADNVWRFRKQIGPDSLMAAWARQRLDAGPQRNAFEDQIDECYRTASSQHDCRLVYADWLEDQGDLERARAQRIMVALGIFPVLAAVGVRYGPDGYTDCNYEWNITMRVHDLSFNRTGPIARYWHRTRQNAEVEIGSVLAGIPFPDVTTKETS